MCMVPDVYGPYALQGPDLNIAGPFRCERFLEHEIDVDREVQLIICELRPESERALSLDRGGCNSRIYAAPVRDFRRCLSWSKPVG